MNWFIFRSAFLLFSVRFTHRLASFVGLPGSGALRPDCLDGAIVWPRPTGCRCWRGPGSNYTLISRRPVSLKNSSSDNTLVTVSTVE